MEGDRFGVGRTVRWARVYDRAAVTVEKRGIFLTALRHVSGSSVGTREILTSICPINAIQCHAALLVLRENRKSFLSPFLLCSLGIVSSIQ
jgi:hypothetical protein